MFNLEFCSEVKHQRYEIGEEFKSNKRHFREKWSTAVVFS